MCAASIGRPGAHLSPLEGWSSHFVCRFTMYLHFQTFSLWTQPVKIYFSINCLIPSRHFTPTVGHKCLQSGLAQSSLVDILKWSVEGRRRPDLLVELNVCGACFVSTEDMMYQTILKQRHYFDRMFQSAKLSILTRSDCNV